MQTTIKYNKEMNETMISFRKKDFTSTDELLYIAKACAKTYSYDPVSLENDSFDAFVNNMNDTNRYYIKLGRHDNHETKTELGTIIIKKKKE